MIRIEKLELFEFRGVRKLTLNLNRKSFAIAGPNGTGKSGIVDAIEFALTGNITRLSGAGTSDISVKSYAPHVDHVKSPEKAVVRLTAQAPSLNKTVIIERSVKAAAAPKLTPDIQETRDILTQLEAHPEFALSRREIIKYILTPAGERAKDVQILLRLDQIEKVRMSLQRIANDTKKEHTRTQIDVARATQDLLQHLGINSTQKTEMLATINERRALLKLPVLVDLTPDISIKAGVVANSTDQQPKARLSKAGVLADIAGYEKNAKGLDSALAKASVSTAIVLLTNITADPAILKLLRQKMLVVQGLELLDDDSCPLCDKTWDPAALKVHLQEKLITASSATGMLTQLAQSVAPIRANLENVLTSTQKLKKACEEAEPTFDAAAINDFAAMSTSELRTLESVEGDSLVFGDALKVLNRLLDPIPTAVSSLVEAIKLYAESLPDLSKEEAAKEYLIVAQEKYKVQSTTTLEHDVAAAREGIALKVFKCYGAVSTTVLEGIYDKVQKDFTTYYRYINRDDEEKFEGRLTPSVGKLAFDVDFYGRGKFPPGAYHSEGHQDGMGLCLYLALMKHTLGDGFTIAVLDDVLMSVDVGHRREVCSLLKTHFPKTQFILTTHDPVWLQFMKTEGLIHDSVSFGGWTVDSGPQVWKEADVWIQIGERLGTGDVSGASSVLRRYLEFISTILADNLRAKVEYHGNGQYDLGDLWPAVLQAWKKLLQDAKGAASSWCMSTSEIEAMQGNAKAKISATQSDQWMINKAIHYNAWANLSSKDFEAVAAAFHELLDSMRCKNEVCATSPRFQ
jgi:hypothetical protein